MFVLREKIKDALNNGTKCSSARMILLTEMKVCNNVDCPVGKSKRNYKKITTHKYQVCAKSEHLKGQL